MVLASVDERLTAESLNRYALTVTDDCGVIRTGTGKKAPLPRRPVHRGATPGLAGQSHTAAAVPLWQHIGPPWTQGRVAPSSLAILIPCLDEERGIAGVVADFRREFPDGAHPGHRQRLVRCHRGEGRGRPGRRSCSSRAGARVARSPRRSPSCEEDLVLMVDGDGSYPVEGARRLLEAHDEGPRRHDTGSEEPGGLGRGLPALSSAGQRRFRLGVPVGLPLRTGRLVLGAAPLLQSLLQERSASSSAASSSRRS